ncbi:hypothetical protein DHEL01_v207137 [Diaporthe helianthi]|uniref:Uncharacterized protein n=1 Tax=Diaporthe helianthi TaxID=158607 RepID=A0A2P5HW36_DIAHE|nr:hypothetical protein DHEL01_v207137 [Diaporthe helianthi]
MPGSTSWDGAVSATEYPVHHGVWTNWSRGRIMGATLTLSRTDGNYLLTFTALFITLVSARFWSILCFIVHKKLSTPQPRDALHHQRQAILRNSASALSSLWTLCQLVWAWRRTAERPLFRTIPVIIAAILCTTAFTLAGGFSSQLSTAISNEVLLDGSRCGIVDESGIGSGLAVVAYGANLLFNAANYAQQCYSVNTSRAFDCTKFVQPALGSNVNRDAPCPFDNRICRSNDSNIYLDTGLIDASKFLGINSPASHRILFRSTLQCAPLETQNYSHNITLPSGNFTRYYYGTSPTFEEQDFTYQAPGLMSQYPNTSEDHTKRRGKSLQVSQIHAYHVNGTFEDRSSDFIPIPELSRDDGDLMTAFLVGNGVRYTEKTIDPWYRGTVPSDTWRFTADSDKASQKSYTPEEAASPLGCLQQYQICNVDASHCGPLKGFYDYQEQSASVFNISQEAMSQDGFVENNPLGQRFQWFVGAAAYGGSMDMSSTLSQLGAFSLSSQTAMKGGLMAPLLENQWQLDVERWWATGLASMQAAMVNVAVGPLEKDLEPYTIRPPSSHIKDSFCNSQILSTTSTSFSLFGIYFTYVVGTIIIAMSYLLEPIQNLLHRRKKTDDYARLEWATPESLQLQRAAYQGIGSGTWTGHFDAIPVTKPKEYLSDLPRTYENEVTSSCIIQAKLGVEKVKPATMPHPHAAKASNDTNVQVTREQNRNFANGTEQTISTALPDNTRQSAELPRPEDAGMPRPPPLAATLPPREQD